MDLSLILLRNVRLLSNEITDWLEYSHPHTTIILLLVLLLTFFSAQTQS